MMERHLNDGETDPDPGRALRQSRREQKRVIVDASRR